MVSPAASTSTMICSTSAEGLDNMAKNKGSCVDKATQNMMSKERPKPECIDLAAEDDIVVLDETPAPPKKPRTSASTSSTRDMSPVPDDPKVSGAGARRNTGSISQTGSPAFGNHLINNSQNGMRKLFSSSPQGNNQQQQKCKEGPYEISNYAVLLDRLEAYVMGAINKNENVDRKMLDALLAAINIQVQKEPHAIRKLILDKQLILPNSISHPPSQVVDLIIEHDPEHQLTKVINKMFGEERPKISEIERRERQMIRANNNAPNMTRFLIEIGQDMVQEATYHDIVHSRNLPEPPKNLETYKQVAEQLKPIWEALKTKNAPFHLKTYTCSVCSFKTESLTVLSIHQQTLHYDGRKFNCSYCPEFDSNSFRIMRHCLEAHKIQPTLPEVKFNRVECPICDQDFSFKGQRDMHLKVCRRDINKIRTVQAARAPEHISMVNRWLWDKPPVEQTLIAQPIQRQQLPNMAQIVPTSQRKIPQVLTPPQIRQQQQEAVATNRILPQQQQKLPNRVPQTGINIPLGNNAAKVNLLTQQQILAQQQRMKLLSGTQNSKAPMNNNALKGAGGNQSVNTASMNSQLAQFRQQQLLSANKQQLMGNSGGSGKTSQEAQIKQAMFALSSAAQRGNTHVIGKRQPHQSSSPITLKPANKLVCEICDRTCDGREMYLKHLQVAHQQMGGKTVQEMNQGAPLACSRCKERFWTYEGLERHLLMDHSLVTYDLLQRAQKTQDKGCCKKCGRNFAFNIVQHLARDHSAKLCSAEIMYSCDVCSFKCTSYYELEKHLKSHPKNS